MKYKSMIMAALAVSFLFTLTQCFTSNRNDGKELYEQSCANCHMEDGSGLKNLIPPIAQSDYLSSHRNNLPCLSRHGLEGSIIVNGKEYNHPMPGAENLSDDQITNLLNYILTNFGNSNERYTIQEVMGLLENCPAHNTHDH